jgi:diphthamide biosynthesis protein 4
MPTTSEHDKSSYYEILKLPRNASTTLTSEDVKTAYHRALLLHHPDKTKTKVVNSTSLTEKRNGTRFSIDDILTAYQTLSDPVSRAAYDRRLHSSTSLGFTGQNDQVTHIGVETVDLEELDVDEDNTEWYRGCRCGDERGYVVTEKDLERESLHGEIYIGCKGCSLFLKVLFGTTENEDHT